MTAGVGAGDVVRVVLVDDQELVRRGLRLLLETVTGVEVMGEAGDGREAIALVEAVEADVVLSDARMPHLDGVGLTVALAERSSAPAVIILTTFDDDELVRSALDAGAQGFLLKDASIDEVVAAVRAVAQGGLVIDPRVARAAMRRPASAPGTAGAVAGEGESPLAVLTRAEREVAAHVATGATNSEIAAALVLAEGTVKNHVSSLLRKLGCRDRTALALLLHRYFGTRS